MNFSEYEIEIWYQMPKLHSKTIFRRLLKTDNVSALDGIPPHGMDLRKDWKVPRTLPTFHGVENALTLALSGSNGIVILLYQKVNKMKFHIYTNSILKKYFNLEMWGWRNPILCWKYFFRKCYIWWLKVQL